MNCPKCGYDLFPIYDEVLYKGKKTKYCKIVNFQSDNTTEVMNGHSWDIKCKCPKCKTEWWSTDSDY